MTKIRFRPMLYITLVNIIGFFMLFLFYNGENMKVLYAGLALCSINIIVYMMLYYFDFGDLYLFLTVSMLTSIGLIMLYRIDVVKAGRQLLWFGAGIAVYFVTMLLFGKIKIWGRLALAYMGICVALFVATAIFGTTLYGSRNWIIIHNMSFQPSELIKIFFCLCIACFFSKLPEPDSKKKDKRKRVIGIPIDEIILCVFVYFCMGALTLVQKEWGTALLLFLIYFTMCFLYKSSNLLKLINIGGILLVSICGYLFLSDHISIRVELWRNPWKDPLGAGYQIVQSLIAITSGGYFGMGIGNGSPQYVPFRESDFIFSAICEEMGIFTGIAIILLYFILTYRGVKTAVKSNNSYLKAACMALVICFGYQTFIIVGGVTKLIPLTGITLPFVSYGGSSMVSCFIMLGIITAVSFADKRDAIRHK